MVAVLIEGKRKGSEGCWFWQRPVDGDSEDGGVCSGWGRWPFFLYFARYGLRGWAEGAPPSRVPSQGKMVKMRGREQWRCASFFSCSGEKKMEAWSVVFFVAKKRWLGSGWSWYVVPGQKEGKEGGQGDRVSSLSRSLEAGELKEEGN